MPVMPDVEKVEITLSSELLRKIRDEAERRGTDAGLVIMEAVAEKAARLDRKIREDRTFDEILAPVDEYNRQMGYTEGEIKELIDAELAAFRREVNAK